MNFSEKRSDQIGIAVIITLLLLGVFLLTLIFNWGNDSMSNPSITVTGEGKAFAVPDTANFNYTIRSEAKNASEASNAIAETAEMIADSLIAAGVSKNDIKTESYNVYPRYEYRNENSQGLILPEGRRVLVGYEAVQTNQVRVRSIDEAPSLLSIPTTNGADSVSQLQFSIWDESAIEAEARQLAIDDAREKAKALADQLGVSLGDIIDYYENQDGGHYPIAYNMRAESVHEDMAMGGMDAKISTGENEVNKTVNITFEIK